MHGSYIEKSGGLKKHRDMEMSGGNTTFLIFRKHPKCKDHIWRRAEA